MVAAQHDDLAARAGSGTPNGSSRPCTTSTGTLDAGQLGQPVLLRPARRVHREGQAEHAGRARPSAAVRQATRAPELRPPVTSGNRPRLSTPSSAARAAATTASQAASSCAAGAGARRPATR